MAYLGVDFCHAVLGQRGALICHAAGVVIQGKGLGIAGISGGGKSSVLLHLLEEQGTQFLSNDRLFLQADDDGHVDALGIPKQPRINPGTITSIPRLRPLLGEERCDSLSLLTESELWSLEEKHDVDIESTYGPGRIIQRAPLHTLLLLNWRRESSIPCTFSPVTLESRPDVLAMVMKSPGPFYQFRDGSFYQDDMELDSLPYAQMLRRVTLWEANGKVDFAAAVRHCCQIANHASCCKR